MVTFEILKASKTHSNAKVNLARTNLNLEGQDIIVGFRMGQPTELQSMGGIAVMTGQEPADIESALEIYQAYLAAQ